MLPIDGGARVLQLLKVQNDLIQTDPPNIRHGSLSVGCRNEATRRMIYQQTDQCAIN